MTERVKLVDVADLERSLPSAAGVLDEGLAAWAIEVVSAAALSLTRRDWSSPLDVPPGAMAVLAMATRRLYTNPDRMTREAEGDYSYGLDSSVTKAAIFTPEEEKRLAEYRLDRKPKGLGTISTYRGDGYYSGTRYVPDGTEYGFPWWSEGDLP